jgi:hypothetical protein
MSWFFRSRSVNLTILVVSFLLVFLPYFFSSPGIYWFSGKLMTIGAIASAFTIVVAVYSQYRRSLRIINRRRKGWRYHVYLILLMLLTLFFGLAFGEHYVGYRWLMSAVVTPLSSVIYGILAFYMASAGARAFRARSLHAALLLIAGFIVLLYQAPLTGAVFPAIDPAATYINETFNMAVSRMFMMSVCVGAIVLGVRMLTGRELSFLGFVEEE